MDISAIRAVRNRKSMTTRTRAAASTACRNARRAPRPRQNVRASGSSSRILSSEGRDGSIQSMKFSAVLLVVGLLAVGVFGFLGMNSMTDHEAGNCIASLVNVVACPLEGLSSAIYHLQAYASFSQAVFSSSLLLLTLVLLALLAHTRALMRDLVPVVESRRLPMRESSRVVSRSKFVRWLSLFENSPSMVGGA